MVNAISYLSVVITVLPLSAIETVFIFPQSYPFLRSFILFSAIPSVTKDISAFGYVPEYMSEFLSEHL